MNITEPNVRSGRTAFHQGNFKHLFLLLAAVWLPVVQELQACTGITIARTSSPYFILDSNKPCVDGPTAAYVSIRVTNTGGTALTNVSLKMDSFTLSTAFRLLSPSDSSHYIGTLAPGASYVGFYFIQLACTNNTAVKLNFNLYYNSGSICAFNTTVTTRSAISSSAGGVVTGNISAVSALGSIICDTVSQSLGNVGNNEDIDFQPISRKNFRADAYELFATKVHTSNIPGVTAGRRDSLYFRTTGGVNPGSVTIVYFFKVKIPGVATAASSFAVTPQGGSNFKYKSDTTSMKSFPVATQLPVITKRASRYYNDPCDTLKYTITVLNNSTVAMSFDRLRDRLPPGATYRRIDAGSGITASNSSMVPDASDSNVIYFIGGAAISGSQYESYFIPPRDSIRAIYWVKLGCSSTIRQDTNTVTGFLDQLPFDTARNLVCVGCAPLAADALRFHGEYSGDRSFLSWEVPAGRDLHEFKLYRAGINGKYEYLHTERSGNPGEHLHYSEMPGESAGSRIYYKLEDRNLITGESQSSEIVLVRHDADASAVHIFFENPVENSLEIRVLQHTAKLGLQLSSVTGALIRDMQPGTAEAGQTFSLSTAELKPGLYYLTVKAGEESKVYKVLKL